MLFKLVPTDDFYEYVSIQLIQTYANSLTLSPWASTSWLCSASAASASGEPQTTLGLCGLASFGV